MPGKNANRKYASAAALQKKCDEYFAQCDEEGKLYGEAGLALHLGVMLATLRKWYDGTDCPDLQEPVQMAYLRIQSQTESDPAYMMKGMVSRPLPSGSRRSECRWNTLPSGFRQNQER